MNHMLALLYGKEQTATTQVFFSEYQGGGAWRSQPVDAWAAGGLST
jgi:hypothetical protein